MWRFDICLGYMVNLFIVSLDITVLINILQENYISTQENVKRNKFCINPTVMHRRNITHNPATNTTLSTL